MQIVMMDLMPVLWGMCASAAIMLALSGEWGAPARTLPAVCAAAAMYVFDYPPRVQVIVFAGTYAVAAAVWAMLSRLRRRRALKKMRETLS